MNRQCNNKVAILRQYLQQMGKDPSLAPRIIAEYGQLSRGEISETTLELPLHIWYQMVQITLKEQQKITLAH